MNSFVENSNRANEAKQKKRKKIEPKMSYKLAMFTVERLNEFH